MSKEVELNIKITKNGKIEMSPSGTQGPECLDLMNFIEKIAGMKNIVIDLNENIKYSQKEIINSEIKKLN
jgi:hypothetical protein